MQIRSRCCMSKQTAALRISRYLFNYARYWIFLLLCRVPNAIARSKRAADKLVLNTALVSAARNFEVSAVAPRRGPRVLHEPVVFAVLRPVSDHFNRVAAEHGASL